ncbi:MAG: phage integrase N-terminal SAM-like domain-containing protein [Verrucomicrobia bacterium]|nr:phage integrase N-terminal SAM-like domain-containing protein [Verrucomicrobiota bacterium]
MKKIPEILVSEMRREMNHHGVPRLEQVEYFKWLRYYLDFCLKYRHSTRDPETEVLYLQKLSSKGQSEVCQEQAAKCICMFRKVAKHFPAKGKEQDQAEELSDWGQVLVSLEEVIRVRQYARTTGKTYRHWVIQFQDFLQSKPVGEVNDEDAIRFLTWLGRSASADRAIALWRR